MPHPCSTILGSCLHIFSFLSRSPAAHGHAASASLCPAAGCRQLRFNQLLVHVNSGQQKPVLLPETCWRGLLLLLAAMFPLPMPAHCHPWPWMHPYIPSLWMRKAFFPPCARPPLQMPPQPTSVLELWLGDPVAWAAVPAGQAHVVALGTCGSFPAWPGAEAWAAPGEVWEPGCPPATRSTAPQINLQ